MASGTITSMAEVSARLRADDSPTPPASSDPGNAMDISNPSTPTRHSFAGLPGQKPLPDDLPTHEHADQHHAALDDRADSIHASQEHDDVDMGEADTETIAEDDEEGSDNDSVTSDSQRPNKKKKGQRFFCTDFPPCQLSFTRSEHLARHIRKHTGERPFQCHCSRRFSRLDNLRQHAQTVHVNEEIPGDSLAATSTRFQRQVRTERVRAAGSRSRGSTLSGPQTPGHARGHSRNLSTSSIGSVTSTFTIPDDSRRRPPALAIATDGLKRPHEMTESDQQYYSQSGLTPTSQVMPTLVGSPYQSGFASPASTISRSSYYGPPRHTRRLSVPSSSNPYQNSSSYAPGYYTPISSQASAYASHQTSGYASPNGSIMSPGRRDSETEIEYRRRTWHPSSQTNYNQRPATSGLSYQQTPDEPMPSLTEQRAATQMTRLPGIESFDHAPRPPTDTMMLNAIARPGSSYDNTLQQGLNRLELSSNEQWQQANPPPSYPPPPAPHGYQHHHHMSMPDVPSTPRQNKRRAWYGGPIGPTAFLQPPGSHRPSPEDSGSSDGGVRTPLTFQSQEYHPAIVSVNDPHPPQSILEHSAKPHIMQQPMGVIHEKPTMPPRADSGLGPLNGGAMAAMTQQAPMLAYPLQSGHDARYAGSYAPGRGRSGPDMGRLEALVAVATSEDRATEKHR